MTWLALSGACNVYDPRLPGVVGNARGAAGRAGERGGGAVSGGASDGDCDPGKADPSCTRPNAEATCVAGQCLIAGCRGEYVDCDQDDANGCETTLESPENCGLCGATCRFNHAAAGCESGRCTLAECDAGYADCDGDDENGCETSLNSLSDCGACGRACAPSDQAVIGCRDGQCAVEGCVGKFADCNEDVADGCERELVADDACGACGKRCAPANTSDAGCVGGECVVRGCTSPFADCNGSSADGCEARLDTPQHCGSCGANCELPHVERAVCGAAGGQTSCTIDHGCPPESPDCTSGALSNGCEEGWSDCDAKPENGCETDLRRLSSCGECGRSCVVAHTLRACRDGACVSTGCSKGYDTCGGDDCRSLASDPEHCGLCDTRCGGGQPNCAGGKCTAQACPADMADCDGSAENGCEASLNDAGSCGGCGIRCEGLAHADAVCDAGSCRIGTCQDGWADCDRDPNNGCEVDLRTTSDCGGCSIVCALPNAEAECQNSRCVVRACDRGRADCNGDVADGCEADLSLPSSCGGCQSVCAQLPSVVSSSCGADGCELVCQPSRANCDRNPGNGCEADLTSPSTCGGCNNDCARLPNVESASCSNGACRDLRCAPGFADCNNNPSDGCERSIRTLTDCGSCNRACGPAHATGNCNSGQCAIQYCDSGFGDCDSNAANGCEAPLSTPANCGSCGRMCANGGQCTNGACACTTDAECGAGRSCCDGQCVGTEGSCFPYPCIPSTDRGANFANCGRCAALCLLWCCGPLGDFTP